MRNPNALKPLPTPWIASLSTWVGGLFLCLVAPIQAQLSGHVQDSAGQPIAKAEVFWIEGKVKDSTDSQGFFDFPIAASLRPHSRGRESLRWQSTEQGLAVEWDHAFSALATLYSLQGKALSRAWLLRGKHEIHWPQGVNSAWLLIAAPDGKQWWRVNRFGTKSTLQAITERQLSAPLRTLARRSATPAARRTLRVQATGYTERTLAFSLGDSAVITLLPQSASLSDRLRLMIGDSLGLKLAWLQDPGDGKMTLHWADLADLDAQAGIPGNAATPSAWKAKTFADSKGATLPSWSPSGKVLAYETGLEAQTVANSRIYLQPLSGTRIPGPAYPATNPRFAILPKDNLGRDTLLLWCASGAGGAYDDKTTSTLAQSMVADALTGSAQTLATGSYNGGLSPDGRYLAAGYPRGLWLDRVTQERRYTHVYPGSPTGIDSLQICNVSISRDAAHPDRMLFIDFGISSAAGYPNLIRPAAYAQHQMLILADYSSEAPGRIVDFIDTPPSEGAAGKTWEDPEWSTHGDFAVATTRLDNGDAVTQPDVYLIRLSTHETLKLFSGDGFYMPIAWLGKP